MVYGASCALSHGPIWLHLRFHRCSSLPFNFNNNKFSTVWFNRSPPPSAQLRFHDSRLSALSNDGSAGPGGGSGGSNSGGGDDDGGEKWSFLSSIAKKLEPLDTRGSYVWWMFVHYWIVVGTKSLVEEFIVKFTTLLSVYSCIWTVLLVYFALESIILLTIELAFATRIREGASEEDIKSLPKYRFSQSNSLMMIDDNMESNESSHIREIFLHPDDSECCICMCAYDDGTEIYRLPCTHHFHCECISRWLRTKAICPYCTLSIHGSRERRRHIIMGALGRPIIL